MPPTRFTITVCSVPIMKLVQDLPPGPLDIVGDIHGEIDALKMLLSELGYDIEGFTPTDRKLVFIGDFCDRGPDSPGVIQLVEKLVSSGNAVAILGNHEINLLTGDAKDGSGWFFDSRHASDLPYYAPFQKISNAAKPGIIQFLNGLPIALERDDLRIVHAAWDQDQIDLIRNLPVGDIKRHHDEYERKIHAEALHTGLLNRYLQEKEKWQIEIESESNPPPFLHAVADYETLQNKYSPFKVLTSGVEARTDRAFFSGNRWRFSDRLPWWNDYDQDIPVVVGHYWRLFDPTPDQPRSRYSLLFQDLESAAWHGKKNNVFCVDYSVGARWRNRKENLPVASRFRLAALQWPEKQLVFDSGEVVPTTKRPDRIVT